MSIQISLARGLLGLVVTLSFLHTSAFAAAPVIFYTDILSGPNTGGENNHGAYLSIFGKGFGTSKGANDKVTIGGVEVAAYKQWGARSNSYDTHAIQVITVQPGSAIVTGGPVVVSVNGEKSNADHAFSVRSGKIFFVALTGDDSTGEIGNIDKPFRNADTTFHRKDFEQGDFIVIRGGTWKDVTSKYSRWVNIDKGASASAPFTIYGYPGETVTYDNALGAEHGFGAYVSGGFSFEGYVFANLRFINAIESTFAFGRGGGCSANCSKNDGSFHNDVRVVNVHISGPSAGSCAPDAGALEVSRSHRIKILGVSVVDRDVGCTSEPKFSGAKAIYFTARTHGGEVGWFAVKNLKSTNSGPSIQVRSSDYTIQPADETWHKDIVTHDSIFFDIGRDAHTYGQSTGDGMKFYNNLVVNTGTNQGSSRSGINVQSSYLKLEIFNNTFYGQASSKKALRLDRAKSLVVKNNIIMAVNQGESYWQDDGIDQSVITASNNIWYGSNQAIPSWDSNPINLDPLFTDPAPEARDFRIGSASPARNRGVTGIAARDFNGVLRPQESAFDIGAFEFCTDCVTVDATAPTKPSGLAVM